MRRLAVVVALALGACANNTLPANRAIESTFPAPVLASSSAGGAELPHRFQVVTFNVHMEPGHKVAKAIATDRAIKDADVIIMQEVPRSLLGVSRSCSAACEVGKRLGYYVLYAPGHQRGKHDFGIAILSKAPITSAQLLTLPFFNVHFNSGRRVALAATIDHAGRPITVYAVHLDNRLNVKQRRAQMLPVLAHAKLQPTPVVIAGDFNTSPFTWIDHVVPVLTTTQDNHFERLLRAHGFDTPVADSGPTHRYIGMKLDGIYTRGFTTKRFATARAHDVSDHLALWALLEPAPSRTPRTGASALAPTPAPATAASLSAIRHAVRTVGSLEHGDVAHVR
jgi:endonuclease/exonuclease/phosphatase family metal-dependent hydrolase